MPSKSKIYRRAFIHKSIDNRPAHNNERLELLGDSILTTVVLDYLYNQYPHKDEGFMTQMKSKMVSRKRLNTVGDDLKLITHLKLNRKSTNNIRKDFSGNTLEALIGAVYVAEGFKRTRKFILKRIIERSMDVKDIEENDDDYKSQLFIYAQRNKKDLTFKVLEQINVEKRTHFKVAACFKGKSVGTGRGFNKKAAEQEASRQVLLDLKLINN